MRMRWFRHIVLSAALSLSAAAQESSHEFLFMGGYSPDSPTLIGTARNRRFVLAGMTYSYRLHETGRVRISFSPGVYPVAVIRQPRQLATVIAEDGRIVRRDIVPHSVYGAAIAPIGLTLEFASRSRIRPFLDAQGGIVASTEPVPDMQLNASGLNFMFSFGGGLAIRSSSRTAFKAGYRMLHVSNAGTTEFNPGLDNNVFWIGWALRQ